MFGQLQVLNGDFPPFQQIAVKHHSVQVSVLGQPGLLPGRRRRQAGSERPGASRPRWEEALANRSPPRTPPQARISGVSSLHPSPRGELSRPRCRGAPGRALGEAAVTPPRGGDGWNPTRAESRPQHPRRRLREQRRGGAAAAPPNHRYAASRFLWRRRSASPCPVPGPHYPSLFLSPWSLGVPVFPHLSGEGISHLLLEPSSPWPPSAYLQLGDTGQVI